MITTTAGANKMKMELSDGMSNHSDFTDDDSQSSQMSSNANNRSFTTVFTLPTSHISFEGLNSGVPTRTTPTLTPTTLRNIEQTFIELQSKTESHENEAGFVPPLVQSIGNQYTTASDTDSIYTTNTSTMNKSVTHWHTTASQDSHSSVDSGGSSSNRPTPPGTPSSQMMMMMQPQQTVKSGSRRNMGGRKPHKDASISPEEEERRQVRRDRNKAAAARCRKRRVDHTNMLVEEVEGLEAKKQALQVEAQELRLIYEDLEMVLTNHRITCKLPITSVTNSTSINNTTTTSISSNNTLRRSNSPIDVKPYSLADQHNKNHQPHQQIAVKTEYNHHVRDDDEDYDYDYDEGIDDDDDDAIFHRPAKRIMLSQSALPIVRPSRPNSLNVAATTISNTSSHQQMLAINSAATTIIANGGGKSASDMLSISTPSNGIQFNFDSLMVGGTGLTPISGPLMPNNCSSQQRIPVSGGNGGNGSGGGVGGNSLMDLNSTENCGSQKMMLSL